MRKILATLLITLGMATAAAQQYDDYFEDRTLRIDYTFSGDARRQDIYVDELLSLPR